MWYQRRPIRLTLAISPLPRRCKTGWRRRSRPRVIATVWFALLSSYSAVGGDGNGGSLESGWQQEFKLADRKLSDIGKARYFILVPGFQTVLESSKGKLTITVLDETKEINGIKTRVVEEREEKNGHLYEISRNFFAIDQETGDTFYFGEDVDFYKKGKVVRHSGAWLAYERENRPGLIMPGCPRVGMKYYQEWAPGVAMDRAKVVSVSTTIRTPAGEFTDCLKTEESSKIKPLGFISVKEHKTYAPGIGLVQDQALKLVSYKYTRAAAAKGQ